MEQTEALAYEGIHSSLCDPSKAALRLAWAWLDDTKVPVAARSNSLGGRLVLPDVSHAGFSGAVVLLPSEQWPKRPHKPLTACTVKLFPGGLPAVACLGGCACMLSL